MVLTRLLRRRELVLVGVQPYPVTPSQIFRFAGGACRLASCSRASALPSLQWHNYSASGIVVHVSNDMSAPEVAAHLGISSRRIRALIASGQLPARQVAGRWMVPAAAVSGYLPKDGGRPMSEHSAWTVLASLAGDDVGVPLRLRSRIAGLEKAQLPHVRLMSWMSARGKPFRAWVFEPVLDDLQSDERLVLGGEHVVEELESSGHLHAYVRADDFDDVVADYDLHEAANGKVPNVFLWAVSRLDAVPRKVGNPNAVDAIVSALDLLDDGDPRAVGAASDIIGRALRAPIAR